MSDEVEFARQRSHQDAKVAAGLARSAAWAAIVLNGFGALAVLVAGPLMARFASWAFGLYALGAALAAVMLFRLFQWIETWNEYWEATARGFGPERVAAAHAKAGRILPWIGRCFAAAMALFLAAGAALAVALVRGGATP